MSEINEGKMKQQNTGDPRDYAKKIIGKEMKQEQPKEKKDWKEKALNELTDFVLAYHKSPNKDIANDCSEWLDDYIQPLQVKIEILEREARINDEENEALQKQVDEYKALLDSATTKGQELVEENAKLKVEIKAWEDQDGIATEAAKEEVEMLKAENERLVGVIATMEKETNIRIIPIVRE